MLLKASDPEIFAVKVEVYFYFEMEEVLVFLIKVFLLIHNACIGIQSTLLPQLRRLLILLCTLYSQHSHIHLRTHCFVI